MSGYICGIDVGIKNTRIAVFKGRRLVYLGELKMGLTCEVCALDAPLTYETPYRDCDREIRRMGIPILPLSLPFMKKIHERALYILQNIRCGAVFEVYPHATRRILKIDYPKKRKYGRMKIADALNRLLYLNVEHVPDDHGLDAITAALTVILYLEGKGMLVGKECKILIPDPYNIFPQNLEDGTA